MADARRTRQQFEWKCCAHCGCKHGERVGHDDTCSKGCNDDQMTIDGGVRG